LRGPIHQLPDLARMVRRIFNDRSTFIMFAMLAIVGIACGWNLGQLPPGREVSALRTEPATQTAPDLQLYREVVAAVRDGGNYYDVAHVKIQQHGFPIASPFNWRLPTYAWVFSLLPGPAWIQAALIILSILALTLAFVAESKCSGLGYAAISTFLLFGVARWAIDGDAYFTQEVWAGVLILISISACRLESKIQNPKSKIAWQGLAIIAGLAALAFRELALPYCCVAAAVSLWHRRWWQAAGWSAGIVAFFAFLAWHIGKVHLQLADTKTAAGGGLAQWLRFGGLDFVLLTTRMNSLLFAAPAWLLWLFVLAGLFGLASRRDAASQLACLAALAYLGAFAIIGRPENFYWGLMVAPLLPWGVIHAPAALRELWTKAAPRASAARIAALS
jgi:hypothetical protein